MSPQSISFSFDTPFADRVVNTNTQQPLNTWQREAIKADMKVLSDAFQITFNEVPAPNSNVDFGASYFHLAGQSPNVSALDDRWADGALQSRVLFNSERDEFNDPTRFTKIAAKELVTAITTNDAGPHTTTYADFPLGPYPNGNIYTVEQLVAVGTKFGSNFHLAAADRVVGELYLGVFDRMPDAAGLAVQVNAVHSGTSLAALANAFLNTAEGIATFGTDRTGGGFVEHLYQNVFGHQPDPATEAAQVYALQHGTSAGQLVVNLIQDAGFQARIHGDVLFT